MVVLKDIRQMAATARGKWLAKYASEEKITELVFKMLDQNFMTLVLKFLNIESVLTTDHYKITHSGALFMREQILRALNKWGDEYRNKDIEITPEMTKEVTALYNKTLLEKMKENIDVLADKKAKDLIEQIIDKYSEDLPPE